VMCRFHKKKKKKKKITAGVVEQRQSVLKRSFCVLRWKTKRLFLPGTKKKSSSGGGGGSDSYSVGTRVGGEKRVRDGGIESRAKKSVAGK